jgi:septal ring factor EnvC (AmiA/AmiB activator)
MSLEDIIAKQLAQLRSQRQNHIINLHSYTNQVRAKQADVERISALIADIDLMIEHLEASAPVDSPPGSSPDNPIYVKEVT